MIAAAAAAGALANGVPAKTGACGVGAGAEVVATGSTPKACFDGIRYDKTDLAWASCTDPAAAEVATGAATTGLSLRNFVPSPSQVIDDVAVTSTVATSSSAVVEVQDSECVAELVAAQSEDHRG